MKNMINKLELTKYTFLYMFQVYHVRQNVWFIS